MSNKKTGLGPEVGNPPEEGKTGIGPEIGNTPEEGKTGIGPEIGNTPEEGKTGIGPEIGNTPAPPSDPPTPPASNEAMIHPTPINPAMFAGRLTEYTPPKGEEGDYHVEMEQVEFDPATGEKKSKPFLQKFDPVTWSRLKDQYPKQGFTFIKVWHDPTAKPE